MASKPNIVYRILMWVNFILLLLFVGIGASGGAIIVFYFLVPFGTIHFEKSMVDKVNPEKVGLFRKILFLLNLLMLFLAVISLLQIYYTIELLRALRTP